MCTEAPLVGGFAPNLVLVGVADVIICDDFFADRLRWFVLCGIQNEGSH